MAELAIKGRTTRGKEVIQLLEMLGGSNGFGYVCNNPFAIYYIDEKYKNFITCFSAKKVCDCAIYTLEEFLEKYPYKVGDKVEYKTNYNANLKSKIIYMEWCSALNKVLYTTENSHVISTEDIFYKIGSPEDNIPTIQDKTTVETMKEDKGNISDGYHTFNELYEYRLLYNASMFNELAKQGLYDVHKSKLHSDGTIPFGDKNWFIVQAELPTGQISNHYEMKDWDLFQVPIKEKANPYDGHTPQDVAKRLREFLTPKPQYPKNYVECCKVLGITSSVYMVYDEKYKTEVDYLRTQKVLANNFLRLKICRDAYWKIAGEQICSNGTLKHCIIVESGITLKTKTCSTHFRLVFPTQEIRDEFYNNFKDLIEKCKESLNSLSLSLNG